jgi:hypothetical protein
VKAASRRSSFALLATLVVNLCLAPCVHGRLGETETALAKRFGQPVTKARDNLVAEGKITQLWPQLTYRQDDWRIRCDIVDGRCARIHYSKPGEWTEEQLQTVLNTNAQGATWTDISKASIRKLAREWKRTDGATATWNAGVGLTVTSPAYDRAKVVEEAKVKAKSRQIPKL